MSIYVISAPEPPWGDYGDILMQGMASHLDRQDGLAQLERTAPFIPNLSFPDIDVIVVTDSFKVELETSGLTGFSFVPVIKARIVHLDWHRWDISADEPQEYPDSGEPEDYLLERPHSPELSEQVGLLWELRVSVSTTANRDNIFQQSDSWNGEDWFRVEDWGYTFVSERTRTWLEARVPNLVAFAPAPRPQA